MDLGGILIALFDAVIVKGTVMVLAAWMVVKFYRAARRAHPQRSWLAVPGDQLPEARLLWWSLLVFLLSEVTCGLEMFAVGRTCAPLSVGHSSISGLGTGLFALALYVYFDKVLLRFAGSNCLVNRVCRGCTVRDGSPCRFTAVVILLAAFLVLAVVPPLYVPTERVYADLSRYALPSESLNAWFDNRVEPWLLEHVAGYQPHGAAFYLPPAMLVTEYRILPGLALLLSLFAIVLAKRRREALALRLLAFAFGVLAYTYLELVLYPATQDAVMGSLGHEVVELWFLFLFLKFLRKSFRPGEPALPEPAR